MPPGIQRLMTSPRSLNEQPHMKRSESFITMLRYAELLVLQTVAMSACLHCQNAALQMPRGNETVCEPPATAIKVVG